MNAVQESAGLVAAVGILIRQRCAIVFSVPALAGNDTGVTADTGAEVDDKPELSGRGGGQLGPFSPTV